MLQRIVTAAIGIPVIICAVRFSSPGFFSLLLVLLAAAALNEYLVMTVSDGRRWERILTVVLGCGVAGSAFIQGETGAIGALQIALVVSIFTLFLCQLFFGSRTEHAGIRIGVTFLGIGYIPVLLSYMIAVRYRTDGVDLLFLLLFITWAGDSGAYFIGTWLGRLPLCQHISPRKTVEGACGGLLTGIAAGLLYRSLFFQELGAVKCLYLALGINIFNQIGDLIESLIKRSYHVKDSGTLVPGHGGVLDRIDSLVFAAPFVFYYAEVFLP